MTAPTLADKRDALLAAWLEKRQYVTPTRFREVVRGHERRVCAHVWGILRGIEQRYGRSLATGKARADARKAARRWAALEAWALDETSGPALPELDGYDPTAGNTLPFEDFAGDCPPDDPDYPWGSWLDPAVHELDQRIDETPLGTELRAAGWNV